MIEDAIKRVVHEELQPVLALLRQFLPASSSAPPGDEPKLITKNQAARKFDCSIGLLDKLARNKRITKHKVSGTRAVRFDERELSRVFMGAGSSAAAAPKAATPDTDAEALLTRKRK